MTSASFAVALRGVQKSFPLGRGGLLEALNVAEWALPAGRSTILTGPSGSGKTTLLNLIAGVSVPDAGTITVGDTDIVTLPEGRRDVFRARHIGYVFQTFNLLSAFTALENVMLAMMFASTIAKREQRRRAAEILVRLGLGGRLSHKPQHLSRGEQQRVAIARALANHPPLVLADEPCASLDADTAREVLAEFLTVCREDGATLLMVSHDEAALGAGDQVVDVTGINRRSHRVSAGERG
ncbi:MAG: ABC transporter ATP-binding protein [Candidatus Rokuibacteriota bacterium]|nr:MAG: ABC transporter ATP-binding protein [Candidatus Rokubacteria bacterium]